jgi:glutathione S-transferase
MIRLWGKLSSINVRKVVLTAQLLQLPFQRTDAGGAFGIVDTPDYQAKNPNAMVPLLEDGEVVLWESNVIVRYLCARHAPGTLYPLGLAERFDAERWMDWQQTTLNPAVRGAFLQLVRVPAAQRDAACIDASVAATEPLLDLLEAQLQQRPWLAGDRLTMADIPAACEVHRWWRLPLPRTERPALARWYEALLALPASRGVLDIELS